MCICVYYTYIAFHVAMTQPLLTQHLNIYILLSVTAKTC